MPRTYDVLSVVHLLRAVRHTLATDAPYSLILEQLNVPNAEDGSRLVERARAGKDARGRGLFIDKHTLQPTLDEGTVVLMFILPIVVALENNRGRQQISVMVGRLVQGLIEESLQLVTSAYGHARNKSLN